MDHVQFLITELPDGDGENGEPGDVTRPSEPLNPADDFEPLSYEPRISPATFCKAFPFHVMMDSDLRVIQVQNQWQIQDFSERGTNHNVGVNLLLGNIFCQKLHEKKRTGTEKGSFL